MAIVQYGTIITDMRGSIGGITFQHNAAGKIARLRSGTRKNPTLKQSEAQVLHTRYLQLFSDLTLVEKQDWNDFALINTKENAYGEVRTLTGLNWFETINYNREKMGEAVINTPPVATLPVAVANYSVALSPSAIVINFDAPFNPADNGIVIRATPPIKNVATPVRSQYRVMRYENTGPFSSIDIKENWSDYFGIEWDAIQNPQNFQIQVLIQTINKSSGIASVGLAKVSSSQIAGGGIGSMIIGDTFIVG